MSAQHGGSAVPDFLLASSSAKGVEAPATESTGAAIARKVRRLSSTIKSNISSAVASPAQDGADVSAFGSITSRLRRPSLTGSLSARRNSLRRESGASAGRPTRSAPLMPGTSPEALAAATAERSSLAPNGRFDASTAQWAVRVDGATGRWYYEDTRSGTKTWDGRALPTSSKRHAHLHPTYSEVHDSHRDIVAHLVGVSSRHKTAEWRVAGGAIERWIESSAALRACPPAEVATAMLRWPAFVRGVGSGVGGGAAARERDAVASELVVRVHISRVTAAGGGGGGSGGGARRRSSGNDGDELSVAVASAATTVHELVRLALRKAETLASRGSSSEWSGAMASECVLKLAGREDYLVYPELGLGEYESVARILSRFMCVSKGASAVSLHARITFVFAHTETPPPPPPPLPLPPSHTRTLAHTHYWAHPFRCEPPLFILLRLDTESLRSIDVLRGWKRQHEARALGESFDAPRTVGVEVDPFAKGGWGALRARCVCAHQFFHSFVFLLTSFLLRFVLLRRQCFEVSSPLEHLERQ